MKWILITLLAFSAHANATLLQYTFGVAARDPFYPPPPGSESDMVLLVNPDSQKIISLTYKNIFFDINFHGAVDIKSRFWWENKDGSGYYSIESSFLGILPDGGNMTMYLEATMPIGSNPADFLHAGTDGQAFSFYSAGGVRTHVGYWSQSEKAVVPEPSTLALLTLGLAGIGLRRKRRLS